MKVTTRQIELTIDRSESVSIPSVSARNAWCPECGATVRMLSTDEAAGIEHITERTVFRMIEAGQVHFTESRTGQMLLGEQSLAQKESQKQ